MALPLDETIVVGQFGHITDHDTIADWINDADPRLTAVEDGLVEAEDEIAAITPSGRELGYAEATSNQDFSGTTITDVTGLSVTFTATVRPCRIVVVLPAFQTLNTTAGSHTLIITDNANVTNQIGKVYLPGTANAQNALQTSRVFSGATALTDGVSYTFKARVAGAAAGSSLRNIADPTFPSFILAEEL